MREQAIEGWLRTQISKRGGLFLKFVSPGNSGVPDRIFIAPGKIIFVELKTDTGRLSSVQRFQIRRLQSLGVDVRVIYGKEQAEAFLREVLPDDL